MSIPVEIALGVLQNLQGDRVRNLVAQSVSKQLLEEIGEERQYFPSYDSRLATKITLIAYRLLGAACSLQEQNRRIDAKEPFFQAGSLLHAAMAGEEAKTPTGSFHELVAAMAFYAAGHYSRAFVALRSVAARTQSARLIYFFLRKDIVSVIGAINEVLLRQPDEVKDADANTVAIEEEVVSIAVAKALSLVVDFFVEGPGEGALERARERLKDAQSFSSESNAPSLWWMCRLLVVMLDDLYESSPWFEFPKLFGPLENGKLLRNYIQNLATIEKPVVELWRSQRTALIGVLGGSAKAYVVNLRTSAGKTRVAEAAIVRALADRPEGVVLYLAPFRSLAYEIEESLARTLGPIGLRVSHLYGGSRVSNVDLMIAGEARVLVATPEKACALLRLQPEYLGKVVLTVIDEGHLLGDSDRMIRNEMFSEYLRIRSAVESKILLLSAVLPNPELLANWLSGNPEHYVANDWRPAGLKPGLLFWDSKRVRLEWQAETETFNPNFVLQEKIQVGSKTRLFPKTKFEAVAAAAVRLSKMGPVLIFAGRALSVPTIGNAVVTALGEDPIPHPWPDLEWNLFVETCNEELGSDSPQFAGARCGVIFHSNKLTPQVRAVTERLMRSLAPKVIVATTTLGQGVNIGISTVIVASPYHGPKPISKRDFWNICGRAGRAYVDVEGRVLFAVDMSLPRGDRKKIEAAKWKIKKDLSLADGYFEGFSTEPVYSGLLRRLSNMRLAAAAAGVDFETLVGMAAENDWSQLGEVAVDWSQLCDLLDDQLLALTITMDADTVSASMLADIVEQSFRASLAAIEARSLSGKDGAITEEELIRFLRARATAAFETSADGMARRIMLRGGLPLRAASEIQKADFQWLVDSLRIAEEEDSYTKFEEAIAALELWIEERAYAMPGTVPERAMRDVIRPGWLAGLPLKQITESSMSAIGVTRDFYGYSFPWVIGAISNRFLEIEDESSAQLIARAAIRVELGLPGDLCALVFMAGVRSRAASVELADQLKDHATSPIDSIGRTIRALRIFYRDFKDRELVSQAALNWLILLSRDVHDEAITPLGSYKIQFEIPAEITRLNVRTLEDVLYLVSPDYSYSSRLSKFPDSLSKLSNDNRYCLARKLGSEDWTGKRRPPAWIDEIFGTA